MRYDDGVPERTVNDIIEEQSRKLAALVEVTGGDVPPIKLQPVMEDIMPRVRCIDTGEEFDTVTEAERSKNLPTNCLGAAIRRGGQYHGMQWEFLDNLQPAAMESNPDGVSTKTRRMAKLRRIAPAPASPPPPAAIIDAPPEPEPQGKLRVRFIDVEYEGDSSATIAEQIASIMARKPE